MTAATKSRARKAAKVDVYEVVTDRICEALEAGFVPWHKPWKNVADGPRSLSSLKPYRGINVWTLAATSFAKGYSSRWWGTYEQIKQRGGYVRRDEKATLVVFWRLIEKTKDDGTVDRIPLLRSFPVFNADQADDLTVPTLDEVALADHEPIEICEALALRYLTDGPTLSHGGDRAYYSPGLDRVQIPLLGQFDTPEAYYATLFHELVHSTGHTSRLNRPSLVDAHTFGSEEYSREELVAEMGAAFVCGEAGIDVRVPEHAAYIGSWLRKLREDSKLLVQAAGAAQKAADLIVARPKETPNEEEK